jgi:hypothetical protein
LRLLLPAALIFDRFQGERAVIQEQIFLRPFCGGPWTVPGLLEERGRVS